jgi:hypothetical protein
MFDTLTYANKLKEAGFTERQAQAQAEALVAVVDSNIAAKQDIELIRRDMKELETAHKRDLKEPELKLEARIAETKAGVIQWCAGSVFASVGLYAALVKLIG